MEGLGGIPQLIYQDEEEGRDNQNGDRIHSDRGKDNR